MVVWVFSGGGEAEVRGFLPFLSETFPSLQFDRRFPCGIKEHPKKLRRYGSDESYKRAQIDNARGATGDSLCTQIQKRLADAIQYERACDLILVFDDLDCKDSTSQCELFIKSIENVFQDKNINLPYLIAFSAPEIEAWIIADWDNIILQHPTFGARSSDIKYRLSKRGIDFTNPEIFSTLNQARNACEEKISEVIQDCCLPVEYYSKDTDSSALLKKINPVEVAKKCPHFRHLYRTLQNFAETKQITSCCPP
jgi:hypothetical protein